MITKNKKNKILNMSNLLMVILFIFGIFIGSSMFPTTKIVTVSASNGNYCYDENYLSIYRGFYDCVSNGLSRNLNGATSAISSRCEGCTFSDLMMITDIIERDFGTLRSFGCNQPRP